MIFAIFLLLIGLVPVYSMPFEHFKRDGLEMNEYAQDLFNQSMSWQDTYWDEKAGFLISADHTLPGRYDTRQSAWYVVGLVARNGEGDVERAERIIANLHKSQYKDPSLMSYGDIQQTPSEPSPQDDIYEVKIYSSYDPNWRDFIGSAFVVILAEYKDRLSPTGLKNIEDIIYLLARGDQYRVGGSSGDLFFPSYTNPWMMRCVLQSFTGQYFGDKNMTQAGENWADDIYDLFKLYNTFSEYNSPTYTGVDMWALGLWMKYAADNSSLPGYAEDMFQHLMVLTKDLYNANLKNFAGPLDRSYGFDMNQYFAITAAMIWGLVGREYAPVPDNIAGMFHIADFGFAHLIALGIPIIEDKVPADVIESFKVYPGEHSFVHQAFSPPDDEYPRNMTGWSNDLIMIGGEYVKEKRLGGPGHNPDLYNPAIIQWFVREGSIGYISLYATQMEIGATAGEGYLDIVYPNITEWPGYNPAFTFVVSGFDVYPNDNLTSITSLPGLKLEVSGNVNSSSEIFYFNSDESINMFWSFNSTWLMPENFTGTPHIHLEITDYPTTKNVTYSFGNDDWT